jgi:hypothetical protein
VAAMVTDSGETKRGIRMVTQQHCTLRSPSPKREKRATHDNNDSCCGLLDYDVVQVGRWLQTFRKNRLTPLPTLKMEAVCSSKTLVHIPNYTVS